MMEFEDGWLDEVFKKAKKAVAEMSEDERAYNEAHRWDDLTCTPVKIKEKPLFDSY